MRRIALLPLAGVLLLGLSGPAPAQEYSQPPMYWVFQDFVPPAHMQEYEAVAKEMVDMFSSAGVTDVQWITVSGPETGYAWVIEIEGFEGIGKAWQNFEAAIETVGPEKFMELHARFGEAMDYATSSVIMLRPDLSYRLEDTALTTDRPFRMYNWYFAIPGKEEKLEGVAKDYIALYESKGIEHGWRVYQIVIGQELPAYLVVQTAMDEADYHARAKEIEEMAGEEGYQLSLKAMKYTRRIEINSGWIRPDLSFPQLVTTAARE
jgi:hypothetical protein